MASPLPGLYSSMQKAHVLDRAVARLVDLLLVFALAHLLDELGFYAGLGYLLIADGLGEGQSLGKRLIRLQTLQEDGTPCGIRESILRNATLGVAFVLFWIPYVGKLLFGAILFLEAMVLLGNERGERLGDTLAGTRVMDLRATRPALQQGGEQP